MKRKNKKQNKVLPVILVIVGLFGVAGIVFAAFKIFGLEKLLAGDSTTDKEKDSQTSLSQPSGHQTDEKVVGQIENQNPTEEPKYEEKQPVVQYSGDNPNEKEQISGAITYIGISNDTLAVRVNIDQYIEEGNCIITLAGAKTDYAEAARVIDSAATSTCEGFNIPLSVLKDNHLDIIIEVRSDTKQGIIRGEASI